MTYAAFISYTHVEPDARIAADIQRRLERFRIPGRIRQETGRDRVGRVFRDREELALAADLGEQLREALARSEYLIVICSPRALKSRWVAKEIDLFTELHGRERILTVLAEGEPDEVIPACLREGGIEPLSCDYRLSAGVAAREELPRLAAALLSCSYDDLVQRQHQYRARRNAIVGTCVAAAFACVSGYLTWNNLRIRRLLRETQVSESRILARNSEETLGAGDRIRAIELALTALTGDGNGDDRPEIPEAIHALEESLDAYVPEGAFHVQASKTFAAGQEIRQYCVSPDGAYLAVCTDRKLMIWDTEQGVLTAERAFQGKGSRAEAAQPVFDGKDGLVLADGSGLIDIGLSDGSERWRVRLPADERPEVRSITPVPGAGGVYSFAVVTPDRACLIDGKTHRIVKQLSAEQISTEKVHYRFLPSYSASLSERDTSGAGHPEALLTEDAGRLWICTGVSGIDYNFEQLICWDLSENTYRSIRPETSFREGQALMLMPDGQIILAGFAEQGDYAENVSAREASTAPLTEQRNPGKITAVRVDSETGKTIWKAEIPYTGRMESGTHLAAIRTESPDGENDRDTRAGQTDLVVAVSETCFVLGADTGEVVRTFQFPAEVLSVRQDAESGDVRCFLRNGAVAAGSPEDGSASLMYGFVDTAVSASAVSRMASCSGHEMWLVANADSVIQYQVGAGNPEVRVFAGTGEALLPDTYPASFICGAGLLLEMAEADGASRSLAWFPRGADACAWQWRIPAQTSVSFGGFSEETGQIVLVTRMLTNGNVRWSMVRLDQDDGEAHLYNLPVGEADEGGAAAANADIPIGGANAGGTAAANTEMSGRDLLPRSGLLPGEDREQIAAVSALEDNMIAYVFYYRGQTRLGVYDIAADAAGFITVSDQPELCEEVRIEPDLSGILVRLAGFEKDPDGRWILINQQTKEISELPVGIAADADISMCADRGELAVCERGGNRIRMLQTEGGDERCIENLSYLPMSLFLDETGLFVLEEDGTLHRYDRTSLTETARLETIDFAEVIRDRGSDADPAERKVSWEKSGAELWIRYAGELAIVDLDTNCLRTTVHDCIGADPGHEWFYVVTGEERKLPGSIPHYTTDDLIRRGEEALERVN